MSVSKNFENIPRSPAQGVRGPKCNFFSSNLQRGRWPGARWGKGGLSPPPTGDRGACRPSRATGGPHPRATRGPVAPPSGDRGAFRLPLGRPALPPYISP